MCRIILGGTGGQGILTLGKLMAYAGIVEGLQVSCFPVYGAEMRGGYAFSTLIFAREEIPAPIVASAEAGIFLESFAYRYLQHRIKKSGLVIVNENLLDQSVKNDRHRHLFKVPVDTVAGRLGNERTANMVAAGFLARKAIDLKKLLDPFPSLSSLQQAGKNVFADKPALLSLNLEAISTGYRMA